VPDQHGVGAGHDDVEVTAGLHLNQRHLPGGRLQPLRRQLDRGQRQLDQLGLGGAVALVHCLVQRVVHGWDPLTSA